MAFDNYVVNRHSDRFERLDNWQTRKLRHFWLTLYTAPVRPAGRSSDVSLRALIVSINARLGPASTPIGGGVIDHSRSIVLRPSVRPSRPRRRRPERSPGTPGRHRHAPRRLASPEVQRLNHTQPANSLTPTPLMLRLHYFDLLCNFTVDSL